MGYLIPPWERKQEGRTPNVPRKGVPPTSQGKCLTRLTCDLDEGSGETNISGSGQFRKTPISEIPGHGLGGTVFTVGATAVTQERRFRPQGNFWKPFGPS